MSDNIFVDVVDREGLNHHLEVPTNIGMNMMEVCKAYGLPVEGLCGGMALCASCHMYVLSDHELDELSEDEENMLDQAFFVKSNSRLGCQIKITDSVDGLKVQLAPVTAE
ncbi:MAG: 2Fe-2S iron-sulfur cluster binding domain-containing protein [Saprospiraceae bacterium]|nr:2Fe-2S iron-sulfur cluster binding domain-containing protein [Saprospiraceae bacterium]